MKNVILVDFSIPENWEFVKAVEDASKKSWSVEAMRSNTHHGSKFQNLIRYFKYFWLPFKIFIHRKQYSTVLAWQQFYGLILAFYLRLFHVKKNVPDITVMTFIYKKKSSIIGRIYDKFIRYIVTSGYIKRFIVFSKSERLYYANLFNVPEEWFISEQLGIEDVSDLYNTNVSEDTYYIAAGRSNRDYSFLNNVWGNLNRKLRIICDAYKEVTAKHVVVLDDCHDEEYLKELAGCYAVIIPLRDENVSSGQLVILQAMMFGKPVIITQNNTVGDYIDNGKTGFIIEKNVEALRDALARLEDDIYYQNMSQNARTYYEERFTLYNMGYKIGLYYK